MNAHAVIAVPSGEIGTTNYDNIFVISDIHGDRKALLKSVWMAFEKAQDHHIEFDDFESLVIRAIDTGHIEDELRMHPSRSLIITLGDIADRGAHTYYCYKILEIIPFILGWDIRSIYGNHDLWSMTDLSVELGQVNPADIAEFGGEAQRREKFNPGGELWEKLTTSYNLMMRLSSDEQPGNPPLESPNTLFVHAGLEPEWFSLWFGERWRQNSRKISVDDVNRRFETYLRQGNFEPLLALEEDNSITQTRAMSHPSYDCSQLDAILRYWDVERIMVGHNARISRRVESLCGGRIVLTDAMMSRWMIGFNKSDEAFANPSVVHMKLASPGQIEYLHAYYSKLGEEAIETQVLFPVTVEVPSSIETKLRAPWRYSRTRGAIIPRNISTSSSLPTLRLPAGGAAAAVRETESPSRSGGLVVRPTWSRSMRRYEFGEMSKSRTRHAVATSSLGSGEDVESSLERITTMVKNIGGNSVATLSSTPSGTLWERRKSMDKLPLLSSSK